MLQILAHNSTVATIEGAAFAKQSIEQIQERSFTCKQSQA